MFIFGLSGYIFLYWKHNLSVFLATTSTYIIFFSTFYEYIFIETKNEQCNDEISNFFIVFK